MQIAGFLAAMILLVVVRVANSRTVKELVLTETTRNKLIFDWHRDNVRSDITRI
jgi:hypothetical protein